MLSYEIQHKNGILVLSPHGRLEAEDFTNLARVVDAHLEKHDVLHGVLIHAKSFPGWEDFGALLAHLKFVKEHHRSIEKVAVAADGAVANILPNIAKHFIHAQVRHFESAHEDAALNWLKESESAYADEQPK